MDGSTLAPEDESKEEKGTTNHQRDTQGSRRAPRRPGLRDPSGKTPTKPEDNRIPGKPNEEKKPATPKDRKGTGMDGSTSAPADEANEEEEVQATSVTPKAANQQSQEGTSAPRATGNRAPVGAITNSAPRGETPRCRLPPERYRNDTATPYQTPTAGISGRSRYQSATNLDPKQVPSGHLGSTVPSGKPHPDSPNKCVQNQYHSPRLQLPPENYRDHPPALHKPLTAQEHSNAVAYDQMVTLRDQMAAPSTAGPSGRNHPPPPTTNSDPTQDPSGHLGPAALSGKPHPKPRPCPPWDHKGPKPSNPLTTPAKTTAEPPKCGHPALQDADLKPPPPRRNPARCRLRPERYRDNKQAPHKPLSVQERTNAAAYDKMVATIT
ncbi:AAEL014221-PA [Aedes aegypti]|uniref:AAEL014221-PA n=1 Tax=Aedes aegypti TaxID=7159 RepID=Q16GY4_AEDAE|nr:AAEL014221-PA [Aedes aegypti]